MIVRAILENPALAGNFDYFNDYHDTRRWLARVAVRNPQDSPKCQAAIDALDAGFAEYEAGRPAGRS